MTNTHMHGQPAGGSLTLFYEKEEEEEEKEEAIKSDAACGADVDSLAASAGARLDRGDRAKEPKVVDASALDE